MDNYYRATIYNKENDICAIVDANNYVNKITLLEYMLKYHGFEIINITNKYTDINIKPAEEDSKYIKIRACAKGQPIVNGNTIEVNGKKYITE